MHVVQSKLTEKETEERAELVLLSLSPAERMTSRCVVALIRRCWEFQHHVPYLVFVHIHLDRNGNFWLRVRVCVPVHFSFSST